MLAEAARRTELELHFALVWSLGLELLFIDLGVGVGGVGFRV